MRVFARERDTGTDELLLTSGVPAATIVAAKFIVTLGFVLLMMAMSFVYPVTAIVQGGLGMQHLTAVFLGLSLLGMGIAAIGLVCSAMTRSHVVAAATTVGACYLLYDFGWTHAFVGEGVAGFLDAISLHPHFARFSEGLVSLADLVYFGALVLAAAAVVRAALLLERVRA
jgi:ABC-2 type transport system permease protein